MDILSDMTTLVKQILQGDDQAVIKLYQLYSPKILRYLQKRVPREEAQEIVNDVFLEAIDALPTLKKEQNLQAWLFRIAHNKTVDFYRKRKITAFLLSKMPFLEIVAQEIHEPEFQFEKDKIRDKIERTLHQLSTHYQRILRMHYEEDMPVRDIAISFNLSYKATESLLFRARKSFKEHYERA